MSWFRLNGFTNDTEIISSNSGSNSILLKGNEQLTAAGEYFCIAENLLGTSEKKVLTVAVTEKGKPRHFIFEKMLFRTLPFKCLLTYRN